MYDREELLAVLTDTEVDVVLLDMNLPGISGIEVCEDIRKKYPKVRVIGLSTYDKGSMQNQYLAILKYKTDQLNQ